MLESNGHNKLKLWNPPRFVFKCDKCARDVSILLYENEISTLVHGGIIMVRCPFFDCFWHDPNSPPRIIISFYQ